MKMVWSRLWTLIYSVILLLFIQKSVCFRIKYEPEESISPKSTIDDTPTVQKNSKSDKIDNEDVSVPEKEPESNSNNQPENSKPKTSSENGAVKQTQKDHLKGIVRDPAMRRLVENEDSKVYDKSEYPETQTPDVYSESENNNAPSENIPEPKINSDNNYSVKESPAELFKGFGRNPAFRKLAENEDPLVYEKLASYIKNSQPDLTETKTESPPEAENSQKNYADIESGKSESDIQKEKKIAQTESSKPVIVHFAQTESAKPVIVNLDTDKSPISASTTGASKSTEMKDESKINALPPLPDETSKFLNAADLTDITQSSGKGEAQSIECDLPHLDVYSRCFANVMEVTVTSRSSLLGRISFQEAEGHIDISGNNVKSYVEDRSRNNPVAFQRSAPLIPFPLQMFYAVYGTMTDAGFMWRLQNGVTANDVDVGCNSCHTLDLRMLVLVMEDNQDKIKRCVVDLTCTQPYMQDLSIVEYRQNESPHESVISEPSTARVHSAKTIFNILKGTSMDSEFLPQEHLPVELGTKLGLSISAYTREISLDLHIIMCEARGEDGLTSTLIKDGCSVNNNVEEFHEVLGLVHDPEIDDHHVVRVTQYTTFEVFNFSPKPQTMAIICKIKMCGGECDERPSCVNSEVNLGHRKQKSFTVFFEEVVLGQMLNVAGAPELAGGPQSSGHMSNIIEPEEENIRSVKDGEEDTLDIHANCIPRSVFYLSLCILGGLFILLLVLALYFSKTIVLPRMTNYKSQNDEVESPSRALYQEYSSPRRRTPPSKSSQHSTMLDKIVYG